MCLVCLCLSWLGWSPRYGDEVEWSDGTFQVFGTKVRKCDPRLYWLAHFKTFGTYLCICLWST